MLIRSQDRCELINFENVSRIFCKRHSTTNDTYAISAILVGNDLPIILGIYTTKEKALRILGSIDFDYGLFIMYKYSTNITFNMPQNDEE